MPSWIIFDLPKFQISCNPYWGYNYIYDNFSVKVFDNPLVNLNSLTNQLNLSTIGIGQHFNFQFEPFQDFDGPQPLTYSATIFDTAQNDFSLNQSFWLQFNAVNRIFSGFPTYKDENSYIINVQAFDGIKYSNDLFKLNVVRSLSIKLDSNGFPLIISNVSEFVKIGFS